MFKTQIEQQIINTYQKTYENLNLQISSEITFKETEALIVQLGLLYNTMGKVIQDLVKVLSFKINSLQNEQNSYLSQKSQKNITHSQIKKIQEALQLQEYDLLQEQESKNCKYGQSQKYLQIQQCSTNTYKQISLNSIRQQKKSNDYKLDAFKPISYNKKFKKKRNSGKQESNKITNSNYTLQISENNKLIYSIPEKQSIISKYKSQQQKQKRKFDHNMNTVTQKFIYRQGSLRDRDQRQIQSGNTCQQCQKFYSAVGRQNLCQCSSRHRSNHPSYSVRNDYSQQFGFD